MERDSWRRRRVSPCSYVKEERRVSLHAPHNADSESEGKAAEQEPCPSVDSAEHPGVGHSQHIRHCAREKIQPDGVAPYPVSEFQRACTLAYICYGQHAYDVYGKRLEESLAAAGRKRSSVVAGEQHMEQQ